jgi:hypothetical protein
VLELVDPELETVDLEHLLPLGLKLLKLLRIIIVRILIPRVWQELICASIRHQIIPFRIVDLSIVIQYPYNRLF